MTSIQTLTKGKGSKLFCGLQLADVATTLTGFALCGVGAEANPVMRFFPTLSALGPVGGLLVGKMILVTPVFFILRHANARMWNFVNVWFSALVIWNLCQIVRFLVA